MERGDALIAGVGIDVNLRSDGRARLLEQRKVVETPRSTSNSENMKAECRHDELGFDRMPFLFSRIIGTLSVNRAFNRLLRHVQEERRQARGQQRLATRDTQKREEILAIAVVNFVGIRFADAELLAELLKGGVVPEIR